MPIHRVANDVWTVTNLLASAALACCVACKRPSPSHARVQAPPTETCAEALGRARQLIDAAESLSAPDDLLAELKLVCEQEPGAVAPCMAAAANADVLLRTCLGTLDDAGTEGQRFVK